MHAKTSTPILLPTSPMIALAHATEVSLSISIDRMHFIDGSPEPVVTSTRTKERGNEAGPLSDAWTIDGPIEGTVDGNTIRLEREAASERRRC